MPDGTDSHYIAATSISHAIERLHGTAHHLLKIWLTLKQMGMASGSPVLVNTSSPTPALQELFSFGHKEGDFFVPFAHTVRFKTMQHDAARSVIQTNCRNWKNGTIVSCDPTEFLEFGETATGELLVGPTRTYPHGLGHGTNGFSLEDGTSVAIPATAFAVWYFRQQAIPKSVRDEDIGGWLVSQLRNRLHLSGAEYSAVFVQDDFEVVTANTPVTDAELLDLCNGSLKQETAPDVLLFHEDRPTYSIRIKSMQTITTAPEWLTRSPSEQLQSVIAAGNKAVLLSGPPRTGKTRAIDSLYPRESANRTSIHIHDGWGYDQLIEGFLPQTDGSWKWTDGPLKKAIDEKREVIVLEEINRTQFTQAMGEVFGLIEEKYRGESHGLTLRSEKKLFVEPSTLFLFTMNTLDKSTEDVDDALLGRCAGVEFPPRVEDLAEMLAAARVDEGTATKLRELFAFVLEHYPLGQGYFASYVGGSDPIGYYVSRIRPVLSNHFNSFRPETLALIDGKVDALFK